MFRDRTEAGERLADLLVAEGVAAELVLAVPRGGLPVGRAVADRLGTPLDVVIARKIGAPGNPELAVGAVAGDGSVWLNGDLVERLGVDAAYVDRVRGIEAENARAKRRRYRRGAEGAGNGDGEGDEDDALPDLTGRRVAVVDDGLATGATAIACLRQVRNAGAERVVLAVPVGAPEAVDRARAEADDVVVVETPERFGAVGAHYRRFEQVTDREALSYLDRG